MTAVNEIGKAPAFASSESWRQGNSGLTKREYIAAAILAALCANPGGPYQSNASSGWSLVNCTVEQIAQEAAGLADALLLELGK